MKSSRKSTKDGSTAEARIEELLAPLLAGCPPPSPPIPFPRAYRAPMDPMEPVIRHCERLLADAKAGKLRSLVYAVVHRDDLSPAGMVDHGWACSTGTYYAVTHAIERLSRAWGRECDQDCAERTFDKPPHSAA